jgi:RNA polymerase sigma factor (sigma-70 family)
MMVPQPGDLLSRIRKGDGEAWVTLTDRYSNLLWSIARSLRMSDYDAADAVQTTWLRLVENLDAIRDPDRIGSWLATTVRRECYDISRRAARMRPGEPDGPDGWDGIGAPDDPLDDALLRDERDATLWRAFSRLRPPCRRLLRVLMADPAPSYAEIAAALDLAVGSIGPTRQRCLKCLRSLLLAEDERTSDGHEHASATRPAEGRER